MANSSATRRGGLYRASESPITTMAASSVERARVAAIRFGLGIRPYPLAWCSFTQIPSKPTDAAYSNSSR